MFLVAVQIMLLNKYKCEPPDIPVKLFANQHKLSCISSIHARINQKITKALFEFHGSICDQTIETSVLLTKVEKSFEDHVQPLIGMLRKWGCDASPQHKLSCISSIHARINQKITKTAIGPKFPHRR
jgi:alpha-N-acetylglucosamine transferase